jgi:hypothetical protein
VSPDRCNPLEFDQAEVERYRTMAEAARQARLALVPHLPAVSERIALGRNVGMAA